MSRLNIRKTAKIALPICLLIAFFSGVKLWSIQQAYQEGDRIYRQLQETMLSQATENSDKTGDVVDPVVPALKVDFSALKKINPDAVAWLYQEETMISYPIMAADDYDYYLKYLPDGSRNINGSLFIDHNNAFDFSDDLTVVYGQQLNSGKMFGGITKYKTPTYFENHPYLYLYTETGNYRVELLYGCAIGDGQWRKRAFMFQENLESLMAYAQKNTTFQSPVEYHSGDRLIVLSTCSFRFDDDRYILIGILVPE